MRESIPSSVSGRCTSSSSLGSRTSTRTTDVLMWSIRTLSRRSLGVAASSAITLDSPESPPLAFLPDTPFACLFAFFGSKSNSIDGSMPGSICLPYFLHLMSKTASWAVEDDNIRSRMAIPSSSLISEMPPSFHRAMAPSSVLAAMPTSAHGPQLMLVPGSPMLRR